MAKYAIWPINDLCPTSAPVRRRGKNQAGAIAASVSKFGIIAPIIVTREREVIDGHAILQAAKDNGYTHVPVAIVEGCSPAEIKTLRLALNKLGERGGWVTEALAADLRFIWAEDPLLATVSGFEMPENDALMGFVQPVADEENVPALAKIAVSRPGDLWTFQSGSRVLCGDAKDPASYQHLLEGRTVQMVLADPPYGIAIKNAVKKQREFVEGSGMSPEERSMFFRDFIQAAGPFIPKGCVVEFFMDFRGVSDLLIAAEGVGLELLCIAVWDKGTGAMGGLLRHQVEFVPILKRPGAKHINNVQLGKYGRNRTTLWSAPGNASFGKDRAAALALHPTCKPISVLKDAILDTSHLGGIVLDMFAGAGSTLVAAYQTRRIGVGIEMDPLYVDVIVRRMQALTGEEAVHAETGLTFAETTARRLADPMTAQ